MLHGLAAEVTLDPLRLPAFGDSTGPMPAAEGSGVENGAG